ncbi:tyrosine-type recombinase/integrase [Mesorhizobium denitrificans]|uniref:tyrosine-type recombinase/integrase n=1 Tax=Mesorhizobium denitrificans TaxID=2294114 RepID=UPI0013143DA3|nr:tyrosine-type recombinase/integrase [Mesorhizobium denitrificans]
MPYITKVSDKQWIYRRKVPKDLREKIGIREFKFPLGTTEAEAWKKYPTVHKETEKRIVEARKAVLNPPKVQHQSELERFREARSRIRALQLNPDWDGSDENEGIIRDVIADKIVSKYAEDEEGHPFGVTAEDAALLNTLAYGSRQKAPSPTINDAKRLYLKERVRDDEKKQKHVELVFSYLQKALGSDRVLTSLKREDAKEVRDYIYDGIKASSADRYLNTVRAALNHAIKEFDLNWKNPFMGLEVDHKGKGEPDRDSKRPFTDEEVKATHVRILGYAKQDLQHIWRILERTGCRLAEVTGLRVEDVKLDNPIPHIVVEWHDQRRIKNMVSRRRVPLLGDALVAAKEAVAEAKGSVMLFPAYGRLNGAGSASAALGKHVRACVTDKKVTTHSLRHLMKDRLRLAGVSKADQDIVLGHSSGSVGEDYGGDEVRLKVALRALEKVFA